MADGTRTFVYDDFMKLIIIRHCETDWNAQKLLQGSTDIELNDFGREQAKSLGNKLKAFGIEHIISSPLKRASQTASIISDILNVSIKQDKRLEECYFGSYEGMTWNEIEDKHKIKKSDIYGGADKPYSFKHVGGNDNDEIEENHKSVLKDIKTYNQYGTILLVGHGTGLNTILASLGHQIGLVRGEYRIIEF